MKTVRNATTVKTALLAALIALTLACGYSSKTTPPVAGTVPAVTQLNPDAATAGGAEFVLTVDGSNFSTKSVVNWNGVAQTPTTFVTANQLTVSIPAAMITSSGTAMVTVTNPGTTGTGTYGSGGTLAETSSPMSFTIN
jgi:hypothetical protein